jgi:hypothetical protein
MRTALVTVQIALALMLLTGAGLLIRSFFDCCGKSISGMSLVMYSLDFLRYRSLQTAAEHVAWQFTAGFASASRLCLECVLPRYPASYPWAA